MSSAREPDAVTLHERLPDEVIDAAITWSIKLDYNHATSEIRAAFERWLHADPQHALAWQRLGSLKHGFAQIPSRLALDALQAASAKRDTRGIGRRRALKLLSLSGIALTAGWIAREHTPWQRLLADASTSIGEQHTLHLPDGSIIALNTDSAVSTDLAGERRIILLRRGEIMITTGADADATARRPFWVYTPFGKLQALGTRFVVRLDEERARISVQSGAVELHPANLATAGKTLAIVNAGESHWLTENGSAPAEPNGFEDGAWADGVIAGKNIRLADLVAELGRYRNGHIACDERVADLRVSGVFHIKNTDQALNFIAQTQPISVVYRTRFWVTVEPKQAR